MSGVEYTVNEKEAQAARAAMKAGGVLDLGFSLLNARSIEAIEDTEALSTRANPIITDQDFTYYLQGNYTRLDALNHRYPLHKFEKEWQEAKEYKKQMESSQEMKLFEKEVRP